MICQMRYMIHNLGYMTWEKIERKKMFLPLSPDDPESIEMEMNDTKWVKIVLVFIPVDTLYKLSQYRWNEKANGRGSKFCSAQRKVEKYRNV